MQKNTLCNGDEKSIVGFMVIYQTNKKETRKISPLSCENTNCHKYLFLV